MISLLSILSHSDKDLEVWKWQVTGPAYVVCDHVPAHPRQCREENGDEMVDLEPHYDWRPVTYGDFEGDQMLLPCNHNILLF